MIRRGQFLLILLLFLIAAVACRKKTVPIPGRLYSGVLFGEQYTIDVAGDSTDFQQGIDSILHVFTRAFDLNDSTSVLARYNRFSRRDSAFVFVDSSGAFGIVYALAQDLNRRTNQFYDPTSNPLKREWMKVNFMKNRTEPNLDSLYDFVGFDGAKMDLNEVEGEGHVYLRSQLRKADPRIEADFTTLAAAYALDQVAEYLKSKGVSQFRISRGHQVITHGLIVDSLRIVPLGLNQGPEDLRIRMINRAFCYKTSKDKLMMVDVTYGYPVENELVYVGVSAKTLAESEIFSEAFMIMGYEAAGKWYEDENNEQSDVQSFMMFSQGKELKSASTEGFDVMLIPPDSTAVQEEK